MENIRIGIVGVGQIGKQHLNAYANIKGVELVAAADIDAPELARVASTFSIPHTYSDFHELIAREDIDAVDVCVHNNLHAPISIPALRAGKHVYCEKPMAGAFTDALDMYNTAKACGKMLNIQLATLFSKETKAARRLLDAGKLGHIYHARSTGFRRRGRPYVDGYGTAFFVQKEVAAGGALYDMGVYHISQMLYLLGMPAIERISGTVYQETEMDVERRQRSGYNVEELGVGFVKCAGNVTLDIIESWAIHLDQFEGSSIIGSQGGIRLNPFSFHCTAADIPMNANFDLDSADWREHQLRPEYEAYDSPQHHWVAALQGRVQLLPCAELALNTMLISEGMYLSTCLGREVTADEVRAASVSSAVNLEG